ncbi:hypothetical protein Pan153_61430 [Gimesia panareensis]|uniref:Cardiolipin synthase N-terminal domain-containing protein n=1 Tax=Gimesia panareensis TaxID=2527978 RepID=A0A518FYM4_9PLAN|nr:PLD nuclease N-terminal domain-containing protein [Gimesia panareensis]QDV21455.1 hypothetical protein Pan153_61430 [Gimesia panareensis]
MFSIFGLLFAFLTFAFGVLCFAFWIWMLIDCLKYEPSSGNEKIIWVLIMVFLPALGSLLYYIVRRPERIKQTGQ